MAPPALFPFRPNLLPNLSPAKSGFEPTTASLRASPGRPPPEPWVSRAHGVRSSSLSSLQPPGAPDGRKFSAHQVLPLFSGPLLSCDLAQTSSLPRYPPIPSVPLKPQTPKPRPSLSRSRPPRHLLLVFPFLPRPWKLLPRLMISGGFPQ